MYQGRQEGKRKEILLDLTLSFLSESVILLRKGTDPGDPYSYLIQSVDTDDTGLYSCVAGNILGETIHTAYLEVNPANSPGEKLLTPGKSVNLSNISFLS